MKEAIILAGNYREYTDWIYDNVLLNVAEVENYVYGDTLQKIMSVRAKEIKVIGTFYERDDATSLYDHALTRKF